MIWYVAVSISEMNIVDNIALINKLWNGNVYLFLLSMSLMLSFG